MLGQMEIGKDVASNYEDFSIVRKKNRYVEIAKTRQDKVILYNNFFECLKCGRIQELGREIIKGEEKLKMPSPCCGDKVIPMNEFLPRFHDTHYQLFYVVDFVYRDSYEIGKLVRVLSRDKLGRIREKYDLISYAYYSVGKKPVTYVKRQNGSFTKSRSKLGIFYNNQVYLGEDNELIPPQVISRNPLFFGLYKIKNSKHILEYYGVYNKLVDKINKQSALSISHGTLLEFLKANNAARISNKYGNNIEILNKAGFDKLLDKTLPNYPTDSKILQRSGTRLRDIVKLTRPTMKYAKVLDEEAILELEKIEELTNNGVDLGKLLFFICRFDERRLHQNQGVNPYILDDKTIEEQIEAIGVIRSYSVSKSLRAIIDVLSLDMDININKFFDYMEEVYNRQAISYRDIAVIWYDYLSMSKEIKEATRHSRRVDKYPSSLKLQHDLILREYKLIESKIYDDKIKDVAKKNQHLIISNEEYKTLLPKSGKDLQIEGTALGHCVASYGDRIANGRSIILFLRDKKDLDTPFCTIEIVGKRISQIQGKFGSNATDIPKVKDLISKIKKIISK